MKVILLTITLVFTKQEIVFARTSPKHKLEIGERKQNLLGIIIQCHIQ